MKPWQRFLMWLLLLTTLAYMIQTIYLAAVGAGL